MSTPPDSPTPNAPHHPVGEPKPAFKVTRSPFAPKIGGAGAPAPMHSPGPSAPAPMAIGGASALGAMGAAAAAPRPTYSVKKTSAGSTTSLPLFVLDLVAAGAAIACAVMIGLNYLNK